MLCTGNYFLCPESDWIVWTDGIILSLDSALSVFLFVFFFLAAFRICWMFPLGIGWAPYRLWDFPPLDELYTSPLRLDLLRVGMGHCN